MAETARSGDPGSLNGDNHVNHNGVGNISPDDNHNNNHLDDDNFHYYGAQHEPNPHDHYNNNNSSGHNSLDHGMNGDSIETQPRYLMNSNRGRISNFYVNGDKFFPGKKVVHNPKYFKDMPHYLDYLTDKLEPRFGAIRKICTPRHGSRVLSLQDIRENCDYVVVGSERFKPFP